MLGPAAAANVTFTHKMSKAFYQWTTVVLAVLVILLVLLHDASCAAQDAPLPRPKPVEGKWGFGVPVGRPMALVVG